MINRKSADRIICSQIKTKDILIIAGPCAVESREQILAIAEEVKEAGATLLRGGAYKPRTHSGSFQGLGERALSYLAEAGKKTGLKVVTEVLDTEDIDIIAEYADIFQVGSRNMHNSALLKKIAKRQPNKPVLLKRGFAASKKELLGAIDYLLYSGHEAEILICERGIRSSVSGEYDRFTSDINLIADFTCLSAGRKPLVKNKIIFDPSHAAGRAELVERLAYAAIAAGADGLIIETSIEPYLSRAKSDKDQHITPDALARIIRNANKIKKILNNRN